MVKISKVFSGDAFDFNLRNDDLIENGRQRFFMSPSGGSKRAPPLAGSTPGAAVRRVLVFGDDTRSFLATVRSLARQGIEVHVAPFDFLSAALRSRYIRSIHWLPYYIGNGEEWLAAVKALVKEYNFSLLIPCDERSLLPLQRHQGELGGRQSLAIPDDRAIEVFFDKHETRTLAKSLGIPIANGRLIHQTDTVESLLAEAELPLVIKPRCSYSLADLYSRGRVVVAGNRDDLAKTLPTAQDGEHFFEAFMPGRGVGVSILAKDGRVLEAFQHCRVHERGGSGFYRASVPLAADLAEAVRRIVDALSYTGLAMFEFKIGEDPSKWILLEVNARPWGSLPLPVGLGVDFPFDWFQLLVDGVEPPFRGYRSGSHARNFIPDLHAALADARDCKGVWRRSGFLWRFLWEHHRLLTGREFHDVFTWDDPGPGFREFQDLLSDGLSRLSAKLPAAGKRARRQDRATVIDRARATTGRQLRVGFICQGNICRSPFAALAFGKLLTAQTEGDTGTGTRISFFSAGLLPRNGRSSPAAAMAAAKSSDIDLSTHRSAHLSRDLAESADLLVVFDSKNMQWLRRRYPHLSARAIRLAAFEGQSEVKLEIDDPDGSDLETFHLCYARIKIAVAGLLSEIRSTGLFVP